MKLLAKLVGGYMAVKEERECGENAGMGVGGLLIFIQLINGYFHYKKKREIGDDYTRPQLVIEDS